MLNASFLLLFIVGALVFTPFAYGQEQLEKATWLESISVIYDQKFSKSILTSIKFESVANYEIQFSTDLVKKMLSHEEIRNVSFTNMGECVMGVSLDEQCIIVNFDLNLLKKDGGINTIQTDGKKIADELIADLNKTFNTNAEFHSLFVTGGNADKMAQMSEFAGSGGVSVAYTMPKEESNVVFANMSELLINQQLRDAGGFYDVAKQLANKPDSIITTGIVHNGERPLFLFKVMHEQKNALGSISEIKPLESIGVKELQRSKHFENHFVPLNSIVQVVIIPENPTKIDVINTNKLIELSSIEDISEKGWFFRSTGYDKIDARFLFGTSNSVTADELTMQLGPWDMQSGENSFSVENINIKTQNTDATQYAILAVIVIAAIGAAIFYLKGYKRNN